MPITDQNICFIDFETTGTNVFEDQPLQIGAYLVDRNLNHIKSYQSYIKLDDPVEVSASAYKIHNIDKIDIINSPSPNKVINEFFAALGTNYCFGGWNISFDVPFFRKMCHDSNLLDSFNNIDYRHIDVQTLFKIWAINSKVVQPGSFSHCLENFGLTRSPNHDAFEDASLTFEVFKILIRKFSDFNAS